MRTALLVTCSIALVGFVQQIPSTSPLPTQNDPAAAELLAQSIGQVRNCRSHTEKYIIGENGERKVETSKNDTETSTGFTLPLVFRPDRFDLSFGASLPTEELGWATIYFKPRPAKLQPKETAGMKGYINKALNHLTGVVLVDLNTHEILRIKGRLSERVSYGGFAKLGEAQEATFNFQKRDGRPLVEATIKYSLLWGLGGEHSRFVTTFDCAAK